MSIDLVETGIEYVRWSLFIASADAIVLAMLLVLSLLITPLATYILTVIISYFLVISTVIPYALIVILWMLGFRYLARYSRRYLVGFVGSLVMVFSYFMNAAYMGYLVVNELAGNILVPRLILPEPIILAYTRYFIVFSLYLPLPIFISLILGMLGAILSMLALYRFGYDFKATRVRLGALLTIIGILLIITPLVSGFLIGVGSMVLTLDLGNVIEKIELMR
ncbi:MAG: hypothetical protein ACP5GY_08620 [Vulcanisaeta sp.]